jgi:hypothetical protein
MLAIITAVTVGIIAFIAFFSLAYVRFLGSSNEQKTAIESAALAAARDISRIAVNTPEYGWVSLSDSAPTGANTVAGDSFKVSVRGINSIIASIRLNLIIANKLNDDNLKAIIKQDLTQAKAAQTALGTALSNAIISGNTAQDINGSTINVYQDSENAYKQNQIRMTGSSNYKTGSLKLALGAIQGGSITNTPVPKPEAWDNLPSTAKQNGFYLSYVNMPFDGTDFVLAGIGDGIKLLDPKQWVASVNGLPYQLPTIVQAEAVQQVSSNQADSLLNVRSVACAQPANISDPKPAPGSLTFSFPDGLCPEVKGPGDILTNVALNDGDNTTFQTSKNGDFPFPRAALPPYAPFSTITNQTWPYIDLGLAQSTGNVFRRALFDWWKRAGIKLDMESAYTMLTDSKYNFTSPSPVMVTWKSPATLNSSKVYALGEIPNGNLHIYKVDGKTGMINYTTNALTPIKYSVSGENQLYSENLNAIKKSAIGKLQLAFEIPIIGEQIQVDLLDKWDVYIRDQVYQPGSSSGGAHNGEPMNYDKVASASSSSTSVNYLAAKNQIGGGSFGAKSSDENFTTKGNGLPPMVTEQSDFAQAAQFPNSAYNQYAQGPGSQNGLRPTYQTNGMAIDVRFRRQVDPKKLLGGLLGIKIGYIGEKYGDAIPADPVTPITPAPDDDDDDD